jgi:hypothetical protein
LFSQKIEVKKLNRKVVDQKKGATKEFKRGLGSFDSSGMKTTILLNTSECKWSASGLLIDCFLIMALL